LSKQWQKYARKSKTQKANWTMHLIVCDIFVQIVFSIYDFHTYVGLFCLLIWTQNLGDSVDFQDVDWGGMQCMVSRSCIKLHSWKFSNGFFIAVCSLVFRLEELSSSIS
jgi:hypothetical protein